MADEAVTLRDINWREAFPFTHLFRAFRVAVHPSKLVIGLVLLACLWCGGLVLDAIWPGKYQVTTKEHADLWLAENTPDLRTMPPEAWTGRWMAAAMPDEYRRTMRQAMMGRLGRLCRRPRWNITRVFSEPSSITRWAQANTLLMGKKGAWPFRSTWRFIASRPDVAVEQALAFALDLHGLVPAHLGQVLGGRDIAHHRGSRGPR